MAVFCFVFLFGEVRLTGPELNNWKINHQREIVQWSLLSQNVNIVQCMAD